MIALNLAISLICLTFIITCAKRHIGVAPNEPRKCLNETFQPKCNIYSYVQFWKNRFNRPKDCYVSPLRKENFDIRRNPQDYKYIVFRPDEGGWNNIRMAAETAIVFAIVTGRVLVLPHKKRFYLLERNRKDVDNMSNFNTFFDLERISPEIVDIVSMREFLELVAQPGFLKVPLYPDILSKNNMKTGDRLWNYLEEACHTREWSPHKSLVAFNITRQDGLPIDLRLFSSAINISNTRKENNLRLKRFASGERTKIISYNSELHAERVIYFPGDYRESHRLLTHFYAYLFFEQPLLDRYYKRLVRDRLHYHDAIFCIAGEVVRQLHELSHKLDGHPLPSYTYTPKVINDTELSTTWLGGNTKFGSTYHAMHIRHGDFQYDFTRISAEEIWKNVRPLIDETRSTVIYISTDETDRSFFEPFKEKGLFTLVFIDKFLQNAINRSGIKFNQNHIGMIEQVICANSHTFVGTPLSSFTGYITRMRGYYRDERYTKTYYTMKDYVDLLHRDVELEGPFWAREFSVAHKNVDDDPKY